MLAEAALKGDFTVTGTPDMHYKNGIKASMDRYGVIGAAAGFDFDSYYSDPDVDLNNATDKLARIMEQKWIASWMSIESWFDWRRTGLPDLHTGPVAQFGDKLALRYMYPSPNLDPSYLSNYEEAVGNLEATPNVPKWPECRSCLLKNVAVAVNRQALVAAVGDLYYNPAFGTVLISISGVGFFVE